MNINAVQPYASPTTNTNTAADPGISDLFLKLLASQLKSQTPLDPVDPTQFVGQLISFNSLSQLMQIRSLMQQQAQGKSTAAAVAAFTQGAR